MEVKPSVYGFQWHDSLMPIGANYTALENAVFECACAGCESIWITVNDDWMPLIKERVGDHIYDPVWYYRRYDVNPKDGQKIIPIFYVPHMARYRNRRDSLGWGIINSAIYASSVLKNMSDYVVPNKFYAAFPFGIYNSRELMSHRGIISSVRRFFVTYDGKTIKNNYRLGFTFDWEDVREINRYIHKEGTGAWRAVGEFVKGDTKAWAERLPAEKKYSARKFTLEKVFDSLTIEGASSAEISWYYDLSTWSGYKKFMASANILKKPVLFTKASLPPIGVDDD